MSKGISTEVLFDFLAIKQGFNTCRPAEDIGYDRIVEFNGIMSRVQIKHTSSKYYGSYRVNSFRGTNRRMYGTDIDFLAVYLMPIDRWMIIPSSEIKGRSMKLNVNGVSAKHLDNWGIMKKKRR